MEWRGLLTGTACCHDAKHAKFICSRYHYGFPHCTYDLRRANLSGHDGILLPLYHFSSLTLTLCLCITLNSTYYNIYKNWWHIIFSAQAFCNLILACLTFGLTVFICLLTSILSLVVI